MNVFCYYFIVSFLISSINILQQLHFENKHFTRIFLTNNNYSPIFTTTFYLVFFNSLKYFFINIFFSVHWNMKPSSFTVISNIFSSTRIFTKCLCEMDNKQKNFNWIKKALTMDFMLIFTITWSILFRVKINTVYEKIISMPFYIFGK